MANEKKGRYIEDDFDFENLQKHVQSGKISSKVVKNNNILLTVIRICILLSAIAIAYFSFSFIQHRINDFQNNKYENREFHNYEMLSQDWWACANEIKHIRKVGHYICYRNTA